VGSALDGFFARPYLLWFVAEDPERTGSLPPSIVAMMEQVIAVARAQHVATLQEQLDYTLTLVAWSWVAARCGVQLDLIDALIDAGASPVGNASNALVNRHPAAAERLVARGDPLTLASATCLGRWGAAPALAAAAEPGERQFALVLAALNGQADALRWLLDHGADATSSCEVLYPHATPLHHAVCSGSLDAVRVLVAAGADLHQRDTAWHGTPLGWAEHYAQQVEPGRAADFAAIVEYLRR
jgi:peptide-methionine (S)-S-oxide reductase